MPRIEFSQDNKVSSGTDFPKLKLAMGEKARIVCIEEPEAQYTHQLRAPELIGGKPVMETVKNKDGSTYEKMKLDFIGRPICLGDWDTVLEKGIDAANCPACAASKNGDVEGPVRRFAMHVVQYNTKAGSYNLANPFGVSIRIWSFTDFVYGKLADLREEWGPLLKKDLNLECTNAGFQNYEMNVGNTTGYLDPTHPERLELVKQTFAENQAKELADYCGRKTTASFMKIDVEKVIARYRLMNGGPDKVADAEAQNLDVGLAELLDEKPTAAKSSSDADATDLAAIFGSAKRKPTDGGDKTDDAPGGEGGSGGPDNKPAVVDTTADFDSVLNDLA